MKSTLRLPGLSRDAYRLRVHSKKCKDLCLQSCYSEEACGSLNMCLKLLKKESDSYADNLVGKWLISKYFWVYYTSRVNLSSLDPFRSMFIFRSPIDAT